MMANAFSILDRATGLRPPASEPRSQVRSHVLAALALATLALGGCATYQGKVDEGRTLIEQRRPEEAATKLEPLANKPGDDQLIYMLDWATALQIAGRYKESAQAFGRCEKIADIQDYHSLSNVAASIALSEEMVQYKGEDFEKVLINAVNAVNYLMMGEHDGALVEVRKVNQKLTRYRTEAKRDYEQNPFAYYLSAMIWEAARKYDDAFIDYKRAYDLQPDYANLKEDLLRAAIKSQRPEEITALQTKHAGLKPRPEWKDPSMGELIFILQQGWGPRKAPRPESPRFPRLVARGSATKSARVVLNGSPSVRTDSIFSVQDVAIKTMEDQFAGLMARRAVGIAAKAVLADQIAQRNKALGAVAWIAMNAMDRADLRQWSTLPESFQVARVYLKAGVYKLEAEGLYDSGDASGERMAERSIRIFPGKKTFVSWRSVK